MGGWFWSMTCRKDRSLPLVNYFQGHWEMPWRTSKDNTNQSWQTGDALHMNILITKSGQFQGSVLALDWNDWVEARLILVGLNLNTYIAWMQVRVVNGGPTGSVVLPERDECTWLSYSPIQSHRTRLPRCVLFILLQRLWWYHEHNLLCSLSSVNRL